MSTRILINLLPHRERSQHIRKQNFNVQLALAAAMGLLLSAVVYFYLDRQVSNQLDRNLLLTQENSKLESQIKEVATLQKDIEILKERQQAVEDLQHERNLPVFMLTELNRYVPEGVYLTSLKQDGRVVVISGSAQSNDQISQFLRNLSSKTTWVIKPELVEITAGTLLVSPKENRKVANFSMKATLHKPVLAEKSKPNPPAILAMPSVANPASALGAK